MVFSTLGLDLGSPPRPKQAFFLRRYWTTAHRTQAMIALDFAHASEQLLVLFAARDGAPALPLARDSLAAQNAGSFVAAQQRLRFEAALHAVLLNGVQQPQRPQVAVTCFL